MELNNHTSEMVFPKDVKKYVLQRIHNLFNNTEVINNTEATKVGGIIQQDMPLEKYTLTDVSKHSDTNSCWIVLLDKVYDITEFIADHPGGEEIILENAGSDATVPFESKGHSVEAYTMIEQYCIGELVEADRRIKK